MVYTKYFVSGMHCSACELLVEGYLKKIPGVKKVRVSLNNKTVVVESQKPISTKDFDKYNKLLKDKGYQLLLKPEKSGFDLHTTINAALILLTFGLAYYLLNYLGILRMPSINQNSSYISIWLFGIIAGFSSCAALVGGLLLGLSKSWRHQYGTETRLAAIAPFILFNLGRLLSFFVLGGLLGLLGTVFQLSIFVNSLLVLAVSIFIIMLGLQMLNINWAGKILWHLPSSITNKFGNSDNYRGKYMPFLAGGLTFFLPCGLTLLSQTLALSTGNFWKAGFIMFFFALGTLPALALISFSSIKFQYQKQFAKTFNLVVGLLIVGYGLYSINSQLLVLGWPNLTTLRASKNTKQVKAVSLDENNLGSKLVRENGKQRQKAYISAKGFEYFPTKLALKAKVPTDLIITADGVLGCAAAMYLKGLSDEIVYLNQPKTLVTFTPQKGQYFISCSMGMVKPIEVTVY